MSQQLNPGQDTPSASILPEQTVRRLSSSELLAGSNRVLIEHRGVEYRLQLTRQGKLILTK